MKQYCIIDNIGLGGGGFFGCGGGGHKTVISEIVDADTFEHVLADGNVVAVKFYEDGELVACRSGQPHLIRLRREAEMPGDVLRVHEVEHSSSPLSDEP
jgi:DUF917 family protein